MGLSAWVDNSSIRTLLFYGAVVRCALLLYSAFHDHFFRVKYTDIDYMIVVDGAKEMLHGGSPFDRVTYRYTPLLAVLVLPAALVANPLGKVVFTLSDLGAAYYCYSILQRFATVRSAKWMVMIFILFNPVVLNVSTRGNSDMIVSFMSMGVLAKFAEGRTFMAAAILGFAVHFKIYPIIYALPLVLGVWEHASQKVFVRRLLHCAPIVIGCALCFIVAFAIPTYLCYVWYGQQYLDEAFIYHVHREDHRHNFSPYWLLMYLNMGRRDLGVGVDYSAGLFAFLPQFAVLFYASWKLRKNIAHACCVETILFVAFNKVCTVQYFVWFLPFLGFVFCEPLRPKLLTDMAVAPKSERSSVWWSVAIIIAWSTTIPLWVWVAYPLEFEGKNRYGLLWIVSCVFYLATVGLAAWLGRVCYRMNMRISMLEVNPSRKQV
ncbi:putative mannosyltransferase [Leptomonas seymouri]|uniref:GPI mannosyltransferase 1 n=1 Tax=Leptomonas seymouri TaxID=5684 RepID=A0A0N1I387_LEPSE|nr:putative mannosyltransferase [Leptomonas seymouri]|eukprot:KPI90161.1 putative mannosyltransferase [Leptomonas seymouri]